jgi:hypothetical protein
MSCERFAPAAAAHAGGDLDPGAAARFERHLAECPECRRLVAELRSTRAALADLRLEPVPTDVYDSIRATVRERLDAQPGPAWRWRLEPARFAWAAGLLLVVVSAGALWLLIRPAAPLPPAGQPVTTRVAPAPPAVAVPRPPEAGQGGDRGLSIPETLTHSRSARPAARRPAPKAEPPFEQLTASSPAPGGGIRPAAIVPPTIQPARIRPPAAANPLEIRLVADDPAVTILWLADTQGGNP